MLRSMWVALFVVVAVLATPERASAVPISRTFTVTAEDDVSGILFAPDRIEMRLTPGGATTFSGTAPTVALPDASGWTYTLSNGGFNAVLQHVGPFISPLDITRWTQGFDTTQPTFTMQWDFYQTNWVTPGSPLYNYSMVGGSVTLNAPPGVVPEPSTMLILGLGMVGAAVGARRRRAATSPVA